MRFVKKDKDSGELKYKSLKSLTLHTKAGFKLPSVVSKLFCQWTNNPAYPYVTYTCLNKHEKTTAYAKDCPFFAGNAQDDGFCKCFAIDFNDKTPHFYIVANAENTDSAIYNNDCIEINTALGQFPVINPYI